MIVSNRAIVGHNRPSQHSHKDTGSLSRVVSCLALVVAASIADAAAGESETRRWLAGAYSFSDELGGFRITGVSGSGTKADPFVLHQELHSASPVTMVIRATRRPRPLWPFGDHPNGFINMRLVVVNNSGLPWIEFEFELQEVLGEASVFGDGLSFDQRRTDSATISSDTFAEYSRDFEPYDRLLYRGGYVDALEIAGFSFMITDFTPVDEFYLVQDPRIPSS
jgi:hypothetical protein